MLVTLSLAFTAGLVSTVNPCGFAMLPAYLGYFIGLDTADSAKRATATRGLFTGVVVSAGFFVIFGIAGALLVVGVQAVRNVIPWVALIIGLGLVVLGTALLRGRYVTIGIPAIGRISRGHKSSQFVFGISYAIASLSCTLPVFLSVVVGTFTTQSFLAGFAAFLAYGLGMSFVLIGISVGLALGKDSLISRLRGFARYVNPVSGVVLVLAGAFVVFYWSIVLFTGAENLNGFVLTRIVESFSAWATQRVSADPLLLAVGIAGGVALAILYSRGRSKPNPLRDEWEDEPLPPAR